MGQRWQEKMKKECGLRKGAPRASGRSGKDQSVNLCKTRFSYKPHGHYFAMQEPKRVVAIHRPTPSGIPSFVREKSSSPARFHGFRMRCARWRVFSRVKCRFLDGQHCQSRLLLVLLSPFRFQFLQRECRRQALTPRLSLCGCWHYATFP